MTEPVDPRLRDFALRPGPGPDFDAIARGARRRRRARAVSRLAAVAVVLLIMGAVAAVVLRGTPSQVQPIEPTPSASSTPSAPPTPSADSNLEFAVEPSAADGSPAAGIGDTLEGLRADAVEFQTTTCPDGVTCPIAVTLTLTNVSDAPISRGVITSVYRDGTAVTGTGTGITLQPGETRSVSIVLDPATPDMIGTTDTPGVYTWNWILE